MACRGVVAGMLTLVGILISILSPATSASSTRGFRATLTRSYGSNHSAAASDDARRLASLSSTSSSSSLGLQTQVENGAGAFLINLSIGTPPLAFPAFLDTGSDLTWTQCAPCTACFHQHTPLYDPPGSSTFSKLPCADPLCRSLPAPFRSCNATGCVYYYRYAVGFTTGYLAADTLAIGDVPFPGVAFGCSTANGGPMDGASGIVGLGRGPLSLVSQLGFTRFSYCLRSDSDAGASPILFGSMANNLTGDKVQSTPLVQNPVARRHAPYYYVNLTGITVGATDLAVTFGFTSAGAGGLIVDSGTTFTYLAEVGYAVVRQAFLSQTAGLLTTVSGAPFDFDLCFDAGTRSVDALPIPSLVLLFAGGAEYVVPRKSYFDVVDERGSVACLLVLPTRGHVSVIGNVMQMDLQVLYDLEAGALSLAPADCASV
ncbi:hypothetical protein PR202_ga29746 [Eleusine coracana subsp. coracana]|uniref:Peptidase A1 domain-containing protein n=1 Tax=Eleusine coracana subsp. coracana TaxID=191504 RepID=A0AAV5DN64_ELECO|nr:hypothetical protein QOZ80_7AG0570130 [Eleusine coracana subsp. coracana]GJN11547.1 hypothetical protein PR202_ga29746 [Eleusine coracana subsp. coracana]